MICCSTVAASISSAGSVAQGTPTDPASRPSCKYNTTFLAAADNAIHPSTSSRIS